MGSIPNPTLYFAYGSNLWLAQMKKRCPDSALVGMAILPAHRWVISIRGFANVLPADPETSVYGLVYTLSPSDEEKLDGFEGVAAGRYNKFTLDVHLTTGTEDSPTRGREIKCLVYIDPRSQTGPPRHEYIGRINRGLEDAKLPESWVEKNIRPFIPPEHSKQALEQSADLVALAPPFTLVSFQ
ncbi:hypothetical protein BOTBODRAFT_27561 [Botryobasidium botryosum FD-172 SS1]|uniref:gamma-glutamylcyclotransferase n=1 Tax=Botryobasidium botryosum (strain FD-172 SS1) TaxID=930990 RepID=A0A067MWM2_BOTB1|nr:hypothetical protein BOTBODRAFT_27561 [Botryobasidium botryosum FD-172 SS1]